jgi:hypothetical protein
MLCLILDLLKTGIFMKDKIVRQLIHKYIQRSELGIKKYGTTLEDNNTDNFLIHLQQELMDASLYIEKLLDDINSRSDRESNNTKG